MNVTRHSALKGSSHWPLHLLMFNTPWKEFREEVRNEVLCALGKLADRPSDRYFLAKVFFFFFLFLLKFYLFILIGGYLFYNIVVVFVTNWHESATGIHVSPILNPPPTSLPHPIPQGHPSAPALSTLSCASNLDWWPISPLEIYMFQCYSLKSSHPCLLSQSPKVSSVYLSLLLSHI